VVAAEHDGYPAFAVHVGNPVRLDRHRGHDTYPNQVGRIRLIEPFLEQVDQFDVVAGRRDRSQVRQDIWHCHAHSAGIAGFFREYEGDFHSIGQSSRQIILRSA